MDTETHAAIHYVTMKGGNLKDGTETKMMKADIIETATISLC